MVLIKGGSFMMGDVFGDGNAGQPETPVHEVVLGDFYLARLYQGAVRRFRLAAWQETVLRKQKLLAEVNDLVGDAADTSRSELLEVAVILLILWEVVAALR